MSPTVSEQAVTELLQRLAEHARTEPRAGREPLIDEQRAGPGRRWMAGVAAVVLLVVAVAGASLLLVDDRARQVGTTDGPAVLRGGTTERLAASGLLARTGAAGVWTGRELLVWGGLTLRDGKNQRLADGAALDPATNRWRPLPAAPIGPRGDPAAVWTGKEMLVSGGAADGGAVADGAAFDPQTNRWRTIAPQPSEGTSRSAVVWTGTEMLVVSSLNELRTSAYDPTTDRWRQLAAPPGAPVMPYPQAVWTGEQAVLVLWPSGPAATRLATSSPPTTAPTVERGEPPVATTPPSAPGTPPPPNAAPSIDGPNSKMYLASYSPASDQWTRLPAVALKDGGLPRLAWTGREVLVLQASFPGAAFDPTRQAWRSLAPAPGDGLLDADAVWTGRFALLWEGGETGLAYDPGADEWSTFDAGGLRRRTFPIVAWTGRHLVGWGGFTTPGDAGGRLQSDGIRYRPPDS